MAKGRHLPGIERTGLLRSKTFVEGVSSGPPVLGAALTAIGTWGNPVGYVLAGSAAWLVVASVVKVLHAREQDKEAHKVIDHDGLLGALHVLQATVAEHCGLPTPIDQKLRVTVHRVVPPRGDGKNLAHATEIEQIVPYVGGNGGGQGRRFSIRSGVTGYAIRTGQPSAGARENGDEVAYIRELVSDWSYTQHDAERLSRGRHSFMAVPVKNGQDVVGVVYLDSSERDVFTNSRIVNIVVAACGGVNRYVEQRY